MLQGWKTIIGLAIAATAQVLNVLGYNVGDVAGISESVVTLAGLLLAAYGRAVAQGPLVGGWR